jgi:hypothetical protein
MFSKRVPKKLGTSSIGTCNRRANIHAIQAGWHRTTHFRAGREAVYQHTTQGTGIS